MHVMLFVDDGKAEVLGVGGLVLPFKLKSALKLG